MATLLITDCINIPMCKHYGILFVDNGVQYVLHNTPSKKNNVLGNVIIETLPEFIKNRTLLETKQIDLSIYNIKKYAYENMHKKWDAVEYNCETLANEVISGSKGTTIMTRILGFATIGLVLLYLK